MRVLSLPSWRMPGQTVAVALLGKGIELPG